MMKIINFPTCSITPKIITNNNVYARITYVPKSRNLALFLTHCSAKPTTHTDNTKETIENKNNLQKDQPISQNNSQPSSAPAPSSRGLVFDLGQSGSWDSIQIGSPVVKRFLSDDQERWYMWYHGRSEKNPDNVGLAISSNGVHWQRGQEATNSSLGTGIVMTCGADWWAFDTKGIRPSEVMIMSSNKVRVSSAVYWMYYTGFSSQEVKLPKHFDNSENVFMSLAGLAISQDGRNWARIEGDHHSGALFDVGSNGEWDSLFVASPHVVFHSNGDLRMYYHSFDPEDGKFAIGLARSRDGIKWLKLGKVVEGGLTQGSFDEMGVTNACVVRDKKDGKYLMAFEGIAKQGKRSIGFAISEDGLKDWRRMGDEPGFEACSDNGWDSKGIGSPCLVQMEGDEDQWRLYYTGIGLDGRKGIGLAVSQGNDLANFTRWPAFHL